MPIDWMELARERYAAYLAGAYLNDPAGTVSLADYILDPTGFVGDHIPSLVYSHITLDPATKDLGPVLSNGNLTLTGTNGYGTVGTTGPGWTGGKLYLEVTANIATDLVVVGIGEANAFRHIPGNGDSFSAGYRFDGVTPPTFPSYTSGDVIGMAVNMNSDAAGGIVRVWWSKNGTFVTDPLTTGGVNVYATTTIGTPVWPLFFVNPSQRLTVNYGAAAFAYAPPTGYSAWTNSSTAGIIHVAQTLPGLGHTYNRTILPGIAQASSATHPANITTTQPLPPLGQTAAVSI